MNSTFFKSFSKLNTFQWILFAVLLLVAIVGICLLIQNRNKPAKNARMSSTDINALVTGALCISLGFVLSYFKLFKMPQGGSVTAASMLPLMLYAYWYGPKKGFIAGIAYALLQYIQEPYFLNIVQFSLDYLLAFSALCLAGFFKKRFWIGTVVAGLTRYCFHVIAGAIFFAALYAAEGQNFWAYSLGYNFVIVIDAAICTVIAFIIQRNNLLSKIRPRSSL